jgi:crossover junction endodeoxyribonuclease RuvC
MIILGIDPGSRITGYGFIDSQQNRFEYLHSGFLSVKGDNLPQRLGYIFSHLAELIAQYQPAHMSIENVFMHKNADSAIKLGQARGAAICAGHQGGLEVFEYAPREVKLAIVGSGAAEKQQVSHMVRRLLSISGELQADEADALGLALCHGQHHATQTRTGLPAAAFSRQRRRRR